MVLEHMPPATLFTGVGHGIIPMTQLMHTHPSCKSSPCWYTDRARCIGVRETNASACQGIHIWSLNEWMSRAPHKTGIMFIRHNDYHILLHHFSASVDLYTLSYYGHYRWRVIRRLILY